MKQEKEEKNINLIQRKKIDLRKEKLFVGDSKFNHEKKQKSNEIA